MEILRENPVGFYDSGIGGITVLDAALELLPRENYVYAADCSFAPYGSKTPAEITSRADACVRFLLKEGAKAVVVACNTATAVAIEYLRKAYPVPIIGAEPAIKPACERASARTVLALVTPATAAQPRFKRLVAAYPDKRIIVAPLPELAYRIEKNVAALEKLRPEICRILSAYPRPDCVVLGCTHYVHVKNMVAEFYGGKTAVLDGNKGIAGRLYRTLETRGLINDSGGGVRFFAL